jgi:basic membrane lipoprotein Med (substrate-binding protein (PBP1-ABC) superfamily)
MVVGAIGVAEANGVSWFGTQSSQTSLAPDIVVANQVYDWKVVLDEIINNVKSGKMGGESFALTLANGGLLMEYNPDFDLPADVLSWVKLPHRQLKLKMLPLAWCWWDPRTTTAGAKPIMMVDFT